MISGQLAPSSANFVQQSNYFIADEISTTTPDGLYKADKINTTFFSSNSSPVSNNFDETISLSTATTTNNKKQESTKFISNPSTNISISDIYNISSNNCNFISNSIGYSSNATTTFTTTTTNSNTNTIHNTTLYNQQLSQLHSTTTTNTNPETTASTITTTTAASTNFNAATIAATNAITDARGRSAALERAYVHDVYENCEEPTSGPIRPRVAQFLANLEPGSIVCDVGCGNGRYLQSCNPLIYTIGVDRCYRLAKIAREKGGEVALCDNLELPFRDESFDAVLSLAVVHHFATTERRVGAIRELARILRIGGRVIISVWALEQRHRRFESQDVLIPWQPPKNRNYNLSDDEDDDDYLPPYHAYTEDSTNSSRSAGDGDSSSLSSSSPGESCYSFVRRAIQKLAGGRKHPWFLDSWNSKDTKNDSSLEYEDAKDLPIELRRLEDFEDLPDPPLSAGLKSRSLGSILNPPPIVQIVRSRSSVPSLGAQIPEHKFQQQQQQQQIYLPPNGSGSTTSLDIYNATISSTYTNTSPSRTSIAQYQQRQDSFNSNEITTNISPTKQIFTSTQSIGSIGSNGSVSGGGGRRPKLVKQKQSLCDEEYQLPDNHVHMMSTDSNYVSNYNNSNYIMNKVSGISNSSFQTHNSDTKSTIESRMFLRKQSSLNEELMAENRLREKERIRKRIQKQMSLNETFLCRSLFTKRLQIIREGFTTKLKTSTGSLERVTKNGFVKIMQNFKASQFSTTSSSATTAQHNSTSSTNTATNCQHHHHYHKNNGNHHQQNHCGYSRRMSTGGSSKNCAECNCGNSTITNNCNQNSNCNGTCSCNNSNNDNEDQQKPRRHSRESGSDSSKDSSLQSDTSIESEDSFASVIFIPKPEQQHKQSNHQQQHNSNSNNGNNSNIYNNSNSNGNNCNNSSYKNSNSSFNNKIPSVPTSPLVMPCPPTPAHSPAAVTTTTSSSSSISAPTSATGYNFLHHLSNSAKVSSSNSNSLQGKNNNNNNTQDQNNTETKDRFTFDEEHIIQQQKQQQQQQQQQNKTSPIAGRKTTSSQGMPQLSQQQQLPKLQKITRQQIQNLPQIPKFRKQQSLQMTKASFPIVRRASAAPAVPKLLSLEIFNPETDDLDSDSSEPSSPDSIDSVISALKPDADEITTTKPQTNHRPEMPKKCFSVDSSTLPSSLSKSLSNSIENQQGSTNPFINAFDAGQILKSDDIEGPLVLNKEVDDSSTNLIYNVAKRNQELHQKQQQQQNVVDFAEQLSAQLLKKLEENNKNLENLNFDDKNSVNNKNSIIRENCRKSNSDLSDLNALKEELRERRLMLANLSTQSSFQHQQQLSPTSSSSTTSSQTRSCSIYDDTNNELRYSPSLFDSKAAKRKFLRNFNENRQHSSGSSSILDTAYLIPDNGGDSSFDDDDDDDNDAILGDEHDIADIDEVDNDVIIEEDEDDVDDDDDDNINCGYNLSIRYDKGNSMKSNTIKYLDNDKVITTTKILGNNQIKKDDSGDGDIDDDDDDEDDDNNDNNYDQNNDEQKILEQQQQLQRNQEQNQEQNQETWGHSNSTNSLDSPSQGGGSTTHHRYYHVFREGELDALINHHVTSLHIVSSYYERASWCVVAEKVQVWTI